LDEFEIIRRYFARVADDAAVRVGVGDDGAVLDPAPGRELVVVVDTLVQGVHYPADLSAADVGYRGVEVNLSDIAAMAGRPRWMTLALTLSDNDPEWLEGFTEGLFESAARFGVTLVGGDTTRGAQTVVSIHIIGDVGRDAYLTRSGAKAGHLIFVTGTPGDAAAGLASIQDPAGSSGGAEADRHVLRQRFLRPAARIEFGAAIAKVASAAIDVSDGLFADTRKLLEASGAGGRIELEKVPLSGAIRRVFGEDRARRFALTGGDDYELCFTTDPAREKDVRAAAERLDLPVACIGQVDESRRLELRQDGKPLDFRDDGYRHFR
jgi:thiamine-monophosphate kinase